MKSKEDLADRIRLSSRLKTFVDTLSGEGFSHDDVEIVLIMEAVERLANRTVPDEFASKTAFVEECRRWITMIAENEFGSALLDKESE